MSDAREARFAVACLAIYLVITASVLASAHAWTLVALHLIVVIMLLGATRARVTVASLVAVLVAWPTLYFEIPSLISALGTPLHDATVQRWEMALFGLHPSQIFASSFRWTWLSELLHAGYLAYYLVIFVPPLILAARGEERALAQTLLTFGIVSGLCWMFFAVYPVAGPRYLWPAPTEVPDAPARRLATYLLAAGSSRGTAFPSSHMAIATVQAMLASRWQPHVARVLWPVTVLIGLGAIYGGFHYAIDIVAGTALGLAVGGVVLATTRR